MNKVILVGRIARDPELRTTGGGQSVCRFAVAVDRRFKREGQPTADFISVVAFGKQAELINQYLGKGRRIALEGRIQTGSYTANDGSKRYTTDVVLEAFDFIDSRNDNGYQQGGGNQQNQNNGNGQGYQQGQNNGQGYQQGQNNGNGQGYQQNQGQYNQGQNNGQGYQQQQNQNQNIDMDDDFHLMADDDDLPF